MPELPLVLPELPRELPELPHFRFSHVSATQLWIEMITTQIKCILGIIERLIISVAIKNIRNIVLQQKFFEYFFYCFFHLFLILIKVQNKDSFECPKSVVQKGHAM